MTNNQSNPDITVRGGIINTPHPTIPTHPPRHQPNTPPNKKRAKTRPDHKVYGGDSTTTPTPPPQPPPPTPEQPPATADAPSDTSPDEPDGD